MIANAAHRLCLWAKRALMVTCVAGPFGTFKTPIAILCLQKNFCTIWLTSGTGHWSWGINKSGTNLHAEVACPSPHYLGIENISYGMHHVLEWHHSCAAWTETVRSWKVGKLCPYHKPNKLYTCILFNLFAFQMLRCINFCYHIQIF